MNDVTFGRDKSGYRSVIDDICGLAWSDLDRSDMTAAAWAYYYFSIQFRENLRIAHRLYPGDPSIGRLLEEECDTDNLSPWPGVARAGEKLDHDTFMERILTLSPLDQTVRQRVKESGRRYLTRTRAEADLTRAISIASYEDGGLERVFKAMLQFQSWDTPLLQGFRHFLIKHIGFDSNPEHGHGALIRHLAPDERVRGLWSEFHTLFVMSVPRLVKRTEVPPR